MADIKQKIILEGEKEYNAAIKDAQRNLKTLRSELKAETAELGKNATAQQKAEVKTKSLQKQIAEQEKIVKANRDALEEVREKYGDNAEVVAKWEQKLNESRAALANMKNSLDSVGESFAKVDANAQLGVVATKSFADALQSVGSAAGGIADSLETAFSTVLDVISEAVTALWDEVIQVAAKANAWTDLADYFGTTAANVQKWSNAIEGAGGSFDDFTTILNKFKTGGVNKKITELFGVSDANYKDDMEYTLAVLDQMAKKRQEMEAAGTWDSALASIFGGRRSQAAGWFISNWSTIQNNASRYDADNGGVGMTTEDLATMDQLYIDVSNIQKTWEAFKESFLAGAFGKLSLDLVGNAQGVLDGLIAFMGAENESERDAAIKQIEENMTSFFTRLGEAIEAAAKALDEVGTDLAGSENGYVAMIGQVLKALSSALEWLSKPESLEQVKKFFEMLIGVWTGAKVVSAIGNVLSFVGNLKLLGLFGGIGGAATSASAAGSAIGSSWGAAFGSAVMKAVPWLAGFLVLFENAIKPQGNDDLFDESGNPTALGSELGLTADDAPGANVQDNKWGGKKERAVAGGIVNEEQYDALLHLWDDFVLLRNGGKLGGGAETWNDVFEKAQRAFEGQEDLFEEYMVKFNEYINTEEGKNADTMPEWWFGTPADTWNNSGNSGLTTNDISGFKNVPGQMLGAVQRGVSGIKVTMDGQSVGRLVAPYVSQYIAAETM